MRIIDADLNDPVHREAVVALTDAYARMPIGGGKPLGEDVRARLADGLRECGAVVFLAEVDERFVGIITCVKSYSSFAARPVLNVHDLAVLAGFWGRGIGDALLAAMEARARATGCVKVTLEVRADNAAGRKLYARRGYAGAEFEAQAGATLFCTKVL
jgi:ribosomal protein S18 acetylase RimI-like enzyme